MRSTCTGSTGWSPRRVRSATAMWRSKSSKRPSGCGAVPRFPMLDTPWLNGSRTALDRARLGAELERNDLALRCGRHAEVLDEMSATVGTYPLDERLAGQLMLGLYRAGRQGEALDCYWQLRSRLADELGVDPGEPLRVLHRQILRADPVLTTAGSPAAPSAAPAGTDPVAGHVRPVADAVR